MLETTSPSPLHPSLHPTPLYPPSRGKAATMQITPNSPIRRPIIRFLLAVRRKKESAPVISTDFHPVQRPPSLDRPLHGPLSPRGRDVTGHRSTEISPSRIGDFFFGGSSYRCVHLRPRERGRRHAQAFWNGQLHQRDSSPYRARGERKHGVHREPSVSRKLCATLIFCSAQSDF